MASIAMRRTKTQKVDGKPLVSLPKKDVFIEHVILSEEERKIYDHMHKEGKLIVSKYFRQGTLLKHYGQVLAILCRLRQLCCHPFLLKKAVSMADLDAALPATSATASLNDEARKKLIETLLTVLTSGADEECSICLDTLKSAAITPCAHVYCRQCIEAVITNEGANAVCPLCRGNIAKNKLVDVPPEGAIATTDDDVIEDWHSSTKVNVLLLLNRILSSNVVVVVWSLRSTQSSTAVCPSIATFHSPGYTL
jgi:SWI/SNF-related matrix-associated actin-dependent regulator of chromatin subfamily A3